ncbi:MAG TPA: S-adenosylmethionine decarboxylase [Candidatus Atribacteria bacterium]|nr:S-adenosylmethionine decarboxylase [Candidatus Atribacteria bacterium]
MTATFVRKYLSSPKVGGDRYFVLYSQWPVKFKVREGQPMEKILEVGMHLVLDGNCQDSLIIGDLNGVRQFLDQFPDEMGMTKVLPPYVFQYQSSSPQDSGISGIVIIAESHISIHTFPARNYLSVDIFSCKAFDVDEAVHKVVSYFNLVEHSYQVFDRGIEYPHDFSLSLPLVIEERLKNLERMVHT